MSSLMKKVFDTMPLSGVAGALAASQGSFRNATVGQLARHLRYHGHVPRMRVSCKRPAGKRPAGHVPMEDPIWGYDVPADPTRVERVTCRVRDDKSNEYLVLEGIAWGYAPREDPRAFRPAVRIAFDARTFVELPFTEQARLMSFTTQDGRNVEDLHWLWPIEAMHDPSIVHVFAYDITPATGKMITLKYPDHFDGDEVRALLSRCQEINDAGPNDDRSAEDFLFEDDLWEEDPATAPPTGTVPECVDLALKPVRVLVALSLTVCRERDDYQAGRPMGVGRIYPHVMVAATAPLFGVDAGLRLKRPATTTLLDARRCGCDEMLPDIGSLLVADSNADGMVRQNVGGPIVFHANLFNYYVPDPFLDPTLSGSPIPVVSPLKSTNREAFGPVDRDCSDLLGSDLSRNRFRVTKRRRQGQFDNIHVAPRMVVKDQIDQVVTGYGTLKFQSLADWKMDSVMMAPFCAHDCFHMHWRWTDNDNTERSTFGWGPSSPYEVVGLPMVPWNQEVFLQLLSPSSFSYLAHARGPREYAWQVFCHHGAGYALSPGPVVMAAKAQAASFDGIVFQRVRQVPGGEIRVPVFGDWALFYWRLRYAFEEVARTAPNGSIVKSIEVVERFSFKNRTAALEL